MNEITCAMIKAKAVRDRHQHVLIPMILELGFKVQRMEQRQLTPGEINKMYGDHAGREYWPTLVGSVTGDVILMALSGEHAISRWRARLGPTDPRKAELGSIRYWARKEPNIADNIAHGSDSPMAARLELTMFFGHHWWDRVADPHFGVISEETIMADVVRRD